MRRTPFDQRLGEQAAQERAIHLHHVRKIHVENVANCLRHLRMIASDGKHAKATQQIKIAVAFLVPEILALGLGVDDVEPDRAKHLHQRRVDVLLMQLVIFPEPHCDDCFQIK